MDTQDRILKLRKTIELNAYKYYVEDNPILEDYEYDALFKEQCHRMPTTRCSWPPCTTEPMHVAKALAGY